MDNWYIYIYIIPSPKMKYKYTQIDPRNEKTLYSTMVSLGVSNIGHKPCGLPGLQHWGCLVVEHDKRSCTKYCVYTVFSGLGFQVFRV